MVDLRRQFQRFKHAPTEGLQGDCYSTAVACVLNRPVDSVPHSHEKMTGPEHNEWFGRWLSEQGLTHIYIPVLGDDAVFVADSLYPRGGGLPMILTALGPRGVNHVVVVYGPGDYWCPTLGQLSATQMGELKPAAGDDAGGYFWAEWIVGVPVR